MNSSTDAVGENLFHAFTEEKLIQLIFSKSK